MKISPTVILSCLLAVLSCNTVCCQSAKKKVILFLYDSTKKEFDTFKQVGKDSVRPTPPIPPTPFASKHLLVAPRKHKFFVALQGFDRFKYVGKIEYTKPVNFKTGLPASLTALVGTADPFQPLSFTMPPTRTLPANLQTLLDTEEQKIASLKQYRDDFNAKIETFKTLSEQSKFDYDQFTKTQEEFSKSAQQFYENQNDFRIPGTPLENPFTKQWPKPFPRGAAKLTENQYESLVALQKETIKELSRQIDLLRSSIDQYAPLVRHCQTLFDQLGKLDTLSLYYKATLDASRLDLNNGRQKAVSSSLTQIAGLFNVPSIESTSPFEFVKAFKKAVEKHHSELVSNQSLLRLQVQGNIIPNQSLQDAVADITIRYDHLLSEDENFKKMISNILHIANPANGYVSTPTQNSKNADVLRVKLSVASLTNKKDTITRVFDVGTKNGFDIDFSTGLIYNTIYRNTYNIRFEYPDPANPNTSERYIDREDVWEGDIAISALINCSFRTRIGRSPFRTGISTGLGLSVFDASTRYFVGGHLYFGKQSSVGVVGGFAFGRTNRLAESVSDNGIDPTPDRVAFNSAGLSSVPTYEAFVSGCFVGLVWNFARK
jgi:uncharacterized coiled-coil protein SlyX